MPNETVPVEQLFTAPATPSPDIPSTAAAVSEPKRRHWGKRIIVLLAALLLILVGTITVTEAGWLNTGIDRLYGKSRLPLLWGGMPADANTAIRSALTYAPKIELPNDFSVKTTTSIDATLSVSSLNNLFGSYDPAAAEASSAVTDGTKFYQILDNAAGELPTQTEIPADTAPDTSSAPALANLPNEDLKAKVSFNTEGMVLQSNQQFAVKLNFAAESNIPNWKSLAAVSTITRDKDSLYVQIPDLSSWPIPEEAVAPYRTYYGKHIKIPLTSEVQSEIERYFSANAKPLDQLTEQNLLSEEQLDQLLQSVAARTRRIGIERVDGHPASHWQFALNKDSFIDLVKEGSQTISTGTPVDSPLNQADLDGVTDQLEQLRQWLPEFTLSIDFWVRRGDYVVVKSAESFVIDSSYLKATLATDSSLTNLTNKQTASVTIPAAADVITQEEFTAKTSLTTPVSDPATPYGRDQQRVADLATIQNSLGTLSLASGGYPVSGTVSRLDDPAAAVTTVLGTTYKDPQPEQYYYGYSSDGTTYTLSAVIEDPTLTNCTQTGDICLYKLSNAVVK